MGKSFDDLTKRAAPASFGLSVAEGAYSFAGTALTIGYNAAIPVTEETVWEEGGIYAYLGAATVLKISSTDINDDVADAGALTVQIYGLDANFNEINEVVILTGQTEALTLLSYIRVYRMIVRSAGATGSNEGIIYAGTGVVTTGVPAVVYAHMPAGLNQTLMAMYTIPLGKVGYLTAFDAASFSVAAAHAVVRLVARPDGEVFQTEDKFMVTAAKAGFEYKYPIGPFAAKTDIEIRAAASANTIDVSALFHLVLLDA